MTLGANIGTTATALVAALSTYTFGAIHISLCHRFFNIFGILIWYPAPMMRRVPLAAAKTLVLYASYFRFVPLLCIIVAFVFFPGIFLGVSAIFDASIAGGVIVLLVILALLSLLVYWWVKLEGCCKVPSAEDREDGRRALAQADRELRGTEGFGGGVENGGVQRKSRTGAPGGGVVGVAPPPVQTAAGAPCAAPGRAIRCRRRVGRGRPPVFGIRSRGFASGSWVAWASPGARPDTPPAWCAHSMYTPLGARMGRSSAFPSGGPLPPGLCRRRRPGEGRRPALVLRESARARASLEAARLRVVSAIHWPQMARRKQTTRRTKARWQPRPRDARRLRPRRPLHTQSSDARARRSEFAHVAL